MSTTKQNTFCKERRIFNDWVYFPVGSCVQRLSFQLAWDLLMEENQLRFTTKQRNLVIFPNKANSVFLLRNPVILNKLLIRFHLLLLLLKMVVLLLSSRATDSFIKRWIPFFIFEKSFKLHVIWIFPEVDMIINSDSDILRIWFFFPIRELLMRCVTVHIYTDDALCWSGQRVPRIWISWERKQQSISMMVGIECSGNITHL